MTSVVISNHWHLLVDLSRFTSNLIQWHRWLPEIVLTSFWLDFEATTNLIFLSRLAETSYILYFHVIATELWRGWQNGYMSNQGDTSPTHSFINIAAAPIPLPIHILVQRISAFLRFNSASPVTTCRTPAITIQLWVLNTSRKWKPIDVLIPRGCEIAMAPPLCKWHCQLRIWFIQIEISLLRIDFFHRDSQLVHAMSVLRCKGFVDLQNTSHSVNRKKYRALAYFVDINIVFCQPSLSKSLGYSINWWDAHIPRLDS